MRKEAEQHRLQKEQNESQWEIMMQRLGPGGGRGNARGKSQPGCKFFFSGTFAPKFEASLCLSMRKLHFWCIRRLGVGLNANRPFDPFRFGLMVPKGELLSSGSFGRVS